MRDSRESARSSTVLGLAALAVLAFALRVIGARSSITYATDSDVVREAMGLAQRIVAPDPEGLGLFVIYKYPLTLAYYLLAVCSAGLALPFLAGAFPSVDTLRDFVVLHRDVVHLVAVWAFAVVGAALVPLTFLASRALDRRHTGWLAASLAASNVLLVHFGHQPRPHVSLATFGFLSLVLLARVAQGASFRWAVAGTVASALTFGVHQIGIAILPTFAVAWLVRVFGRRERLAQALLEAGAHLVFLVALCLAVYPAFAPEALGLVQSYFAGESDYRLGSGAHRFGTSAVDGHNLIRLAANLYWYQPLITVSAIAGLPYLAWKLRARREVLLVGAAFLVFAALPIGSFAENFPRMTAIVIPLLILAAAHLVEDAAIAIGRGRSIRRERVLAALAFLVVAPCFVTACRLVYVTAQKDTRTLAREWLEVHARSGETVLANYQIPEALPSQESLRRQASAAPKTLGTVRQWLLTRPRDERFPELPFQLIDYGGAWPDDRSLQEELVRERNVRWAAFQVAYWRSVGESSRISEYLATHGRLVEVICPGRAPTPIAWPEDWDARPRGFYLPEDVETEVWRHVWQVERPGPIMLLFEVASAPLREAPNAAEIAASCR